MKIIFPSSNSVSAVFSPKNMQEEMFTQAEAIAFLQNSWGITNIKNRLENDRRNLLDEIIVAILANVPFQSVTLIATPSEERHKFPTFEKIKKACMAGIGGLCYTVNTFTWGLLKGLGFSARLSLSTVTSTVTCENNHLIILVCDLEKHGDVYLVDCGSGFPLFHAVSLDFDQESPVYQDGFLEYKYVRHDGRILRMHGKGDLIKRNNPPIEGLDFFVGKWRRFYSFVPGASDLDKPLNDHYSATIVQTPFPASPRAIRFPKKRAVMITNSRLIVETEEGQLVPTIMESDNEIMEAYRVHFPSLTQDAVRLAIAEWRRVSK